MTDDDLTGKCEFCHTPIHWMTDVCDRHAMTNEQLAELGRRIQEAQRSYCLEIWPDLVGRGEQE